MDEVCCGTGLAETTLRLSSPRSCQVFQRDAVDQANVALQGAIIGEVDVVEAKAELCQGAAHGEATGWVVVAEKFADGRFTGKLPLQAGGWYKLTARARKGGRIVAEAAVDCVGAGEVFITAGQSNSANFGQPRQSSKDGRVVYFNGKAFVPASDPIPDGCGDGGSVWPLLGDLIVQSQGVPVCFRSASLTWTEVKNWMPPDTELYRNLVQCVKAFGADGARAVLWHQGESDSLAKTPASTYCERLGTVIAALGHDCGHPLPWFVAQTSFHPQAQAPEQLEVAKGQQMLWDGKTAFRGLATNDLLGAEYRHDGVHFSQAGLDIHARRWFEALRGVYGWCSSSGRTRATWR